MPSSHRKKVKSYNDPGHAHELTFSCFRRQPLLTKDGLDMVERSLLCGRDGCAYPAGPAP